MARAAQLRRARAGHVTRDAVARRAGVSSATVSRAYNRPDLVAPHRLDRVRAAAAELGYVPDRNASALRRAGTGRIVMLERQGRSGVFEDRIYRWFYADMLRGAREVLDRTPYQLGVHAFGSVSELERAHAGAFGDGVLVHGDGDERLLRLLKKRAIPYVACGQLPRSPWVNCVHTDNVAGAARAARALRDAGLTRPAHVTGELTRTEVCALRWAGFQRGFEGVRIELIDGALGVEGGLRSGRILLGAIARGAVDSVFVVNDLTAVGVMRALLEGGVRIPDDVSVIGYDNLPFLDVLPLRLSTIDIAFGEVYARATERLIAAIAKDQPIRESVEPRYIQGQTVRSRV